MGIFNFFNSKKNEQKDAVPHMFNSIFPKGRKDMYAGADELLRILNNSITREEARDILVKSAALSRITKKFDKERLITHLSGYCLHHFNEKQIEQFYNYLVALSAAMLIHRRTPSEIRREGETYLW